MATDLIPHKEWLKRTSVMGRRRSPLLKRLDECLEMYDRFGGGDSRWRVEQALKAWQESKGPADAWKQSSRNKKDRAVEDLEKLLAGNYLGDRDQIAYEAMEEHRQEFIGELFRDRKLVLSGKLITTYETVASVYDTTKLGFRAKHVATTIDDQRVTSKLVADALGEAYSDPAMANLVGQIFGESVGEFVKSITPGVSLVKSASMTVFSGLATYAKAKQVKGMHGAQVAFNPGDPEAAFRAVETLAKRELAKSSIELATHAAETGTKTAGFFVDGSTATAAVASTAGTLARLLLTLKYLKRDWSEQRAANKLLANPEGITNELFNQNPLLGCYFVACATDSVLLNFMFDKNMALPSFMPRVEKSVKKHLDPTRRAATHCIFNHRMALSGGSLPKLSVHSSGHQNKIAVRQPGTYQHITAKVMNTVKRRDAGFYD